jgi:hypothetical protein
MPFPVRRLAGVAIITALLLLLTGPQLRAETKSFNFLDLMRALKIAPTTEAVATHQGYVLRGIQTGTDDTMPQAGDNVTALVELSSFDGKLPPAQWIIRLQLAAKISAASAKGKTNDWTEYTNTGDKFAFHSDQTGMKLETLGPIKADAKPEEPLPVKRQEISAAADFLSLDLSRAARVIGRISGQPNTGNTLSLAAGPKSFPASDVKLQRPRADALHLTTDDLRSFSGSLPALMQFLDIVRNTPGLQDILYQVIDKPSLIDVFRSGASSAIDFNFLGGGALADGQDFFWPDAKHEDFSGMMFELIVFRKPILIVALNMVTPRPPLLATAGIVGIVACKPHPDQSDKFVVVRVVSATSGAGTGPVPEPARP